MRKTRGFSLVETIVAIGIIAFLLTVVLPNIFKAVVKAKIVQVLADTANLRAAASGYYSDTGLWPSDVCPEEDPGFVSWDAYKTRCCGWSADDESLLESMALASGDDYETTLANYWDGPYLEKWPSPTPWGGSYDWEFWPTGEWAQPPGVYVSVRERYSHQTCSNPSLPFDTGVPVNYEIKMQIAGIDAHCNGGFSASPPACNATNRKLPDPQELVTIPIMYFNITN